MEMIIEVGSVEKASAYIENALNTKQKIMGFGHRVYKVDDARKPHLKSMARKLWEEKNDMKLFNVSEEIEKQVKARKEIITNVDFYSGILLWALGFPLSMYTAVFSVARTVGWVAHWKEMIEEPTRKISRPRQLYTGHRKRKYIELDKREHKKSILKSISAIIKTSLKSR